MNQMQEGNTPQSKPSCVNASNLVITVIGILVTGLAVGFIFYSIQQPLINNLDVQVSDLRSQMVLIQSKLSGREESNSQEEIEKTGSEVSSINNDWNLYTNYDLGFSVKIPKDAQKLEMTDLNFAFIYQIGNNIGKQNVVNGYLEKLNSDLPVIDRLKGVPWAILAKDVKDEAELQSLIMQRYGSSCTLGSRQATAQLGTYRYSIEGDGLALDKSQCPINFVMHIIYSPDLGKVAIWDVGQGYNFILDDVGVDHLMTDSFQFIK